MLLKKHGLSYRFYADDSQLYMSFKPGHLQANVNTMALENCIGDIKHWMIQNGLQLNTDKTGISSVWYTPAINNSTGKTFSIEYLQDNQHPTSPLPLFAHCLLSH